MVLFVTLNEQRDHFSELYKVYCAFTPALARNNSFLRSLEGKPAQEVADLDFLNTCKIISGRHVTKFTRLESTLQLMKRRISSFDSKLVIDQHEKFFKTDYYKAAYLGQ